MPCSEVPTIETISGTECIGDSLPKINNNFTKLEGAACDLYTKVNILSTGVEGLYLNNNSLSETLNNFFYGNIRAFVNFNPNSAQGSAAFYTPGGPYNWTAPGGITSVTARIVGGGGGGSYGRADLAGSGSSGAGGGGGANLLVNVSVNPGQTYQIFVGNGATYSVPFNPQPGPGGSSSFAGTVALGGQTPNFNTPNNSPIIGGAAGGSGGTAGQNGSLSFGHPGGNGGSSFGSGGIASTIQNQRIVPAPNSGGGGYGAPNRFFDSNEASRGASGRVELFWAATGGISYRDRLNIDYIEKITTGRYRIHFISGTFQNANYVFVGTARQANDSNSSPATISALSNDSKTQNSIEIVAKQGGTLIDPTEICLAFFNLKV